MKLPKYLLDRDLGCFSFVRGTFDVLYTLFYEAIILGVMRAASHALKAIFVCESVLFCGADGLPIVSEYFLGGFSSQDK